MKTIVTHISPDLDSITAIWLVKKFYPGWDDATLTFVPAGTTLEGKNPDQDPNVLHVDTGLGKFDHHQTDEYTSATKRLYEYLLEKNLVPEKSVAALERLVELVNDIDHFGEVNYPDPTSDR
ncbi:hypothetical protein HYW87_04150, partial [Candidatus Roizmanbacteria bacterium]|nr:hypothetical protein [Candidatus Roizmanbacteria bacterium]